MLLRFDAVYHPLYKLNRSRLADLSHLPAYLRDLYQQDEAADGLDWDAIKRLHFWRALPINHRQLVPRGGVPNLALPHGRAARFASESVMQARTDAVAAGKVSDCAVRT